MVYDFICSTRYDLFKMSLNWNIIVISLFSFSTFFNINNNLIFFFQVDDYIVRDDIKNIVHNHDPVPFDLGELIFFFTVKCFLYN